MEVLNRHITHMLMLICALSLLSCGGSSDKSSPAPVPQGTEQRGIAQDNIIPDDPAEPAKLFQPPPKKLVPTEDKLPQLKKTHVELFTITETNTDKLDFVIFEQSQSEKLDVYKHIGNRLYLNQSLYHQCFPETSAQQKCYIVEYIVNYEGQGRLGKNKSYFFSNSLPFSVAPEPFGKDKNDLVLDLLESLSKLKDIRFPDSKLNISKQDNLYYLNKLAFETDQESFSKKIKIVKKVAPILKRHLQKAPTQLIMETMSIGSVEFKTKITPRHIGTFDEVHLYDQ